MANRLALLIVAWLATDFAGAQSASESPEARAARFYAAGLEQPLMQLRTGALLLQTCTQRLRRACTKPQRQLTANSRMLALLDVLTLFPQRPAADPAAEMKKAKQLEEAIAVTRTALMRDAGEYDRLLIARYGATLRACPDDDAPAQRASLDEQTRLDLAGFQALNGDELARAMESIAHDEASVAEELQRSPAGECSTAREVGEFLMQLMHSKLQPWSGEDRFVDHQDREFDFSAPVKPKTDEISTRDVATSVAGNFVMVVATELQLKVSPESALQIKAIGDAAGIAP
jgi:hypothetical protein